MVSPAFLCWDCAKNGEARARIDAARSRAVPLFILLRTSQNAQKLLEKFETDGSHKRDSSGIEAGKVVCSGPAHSEQPARLRAETRRAAASRIRCTFHSTYKHSI